MSEKVTYLSEIISVLENHNGVASFNTICDEIERRNILPSIHTNNNWKSQVSNSLTTHCQEMDSYRGENLFYSVYGKGKGVYGLVDYEDVDVALTQEDIEFSEGKKYLAEHIRRERNQCLISQAKRRFVQNNGHLFCEACGFDFEKKYGELGKNFIEAHHTKPVSQMQDGEKTKLEDIVMLCSNCHSMVHRNKSWLSKDEIINMFNK